jgi:DNA repair protein RecN (Recombination protein N)
LLATAVKALSGSDLEEGEGAVAYLQRGLVYLEKAARIDDRLKEMSQLLQSALPSIEDTASNLRKYAQTLDVDPETLSRVEARLGVLLSLKRKYGASLKEVILHREKLANEIDQLENSQGRIAEVDVELKAIQEKLECSAIELSQKRVQLASQLSRAMERELSELGMEHAKFDIALNKQEEIGSFGWERVEFVIAPNPGQPLMPLSKIASGGELSRIMLAIKTIFAEADKVATVIFDEIDAGLSGKVLSTMRDKLVRLAKSHQILCITHQPLIASVSDNHVEVEKVQSINMTTVTMRILSGEERVGVLAQMASGQGTAESAINFARSLIEQANQLK